MHVRKKWRPPGMSVKMFSFLMDLHSIRVHFIFGVELGDWFEVFLGPGVMDQPGSEAVGIGAEAYVNISEFLASTERWRPTLEAWRAALHVAMITQGTIAELSISMSNLATWSLCWLCMSRIVVSRRFYLQEMASKGSKECMLFVLICTK